jgi:catechol 2,3-dioxygenase-like lactoylglutathione lyase family enzyme
MFSHIIIGADDMAAARDFYDAALGALGVPPGRDDPQGRIFYKNSAGLFGITRPIDGRPASGANGGTIGFAAASPDEVDAWHAAGSKAGGTPCEEPPGVRDRSGRRIYLAYLRDPAGNKLCAAYRFPT